MRSRFGSIALVGVAVAMALLPGAASAKSKTVYADAPPSAQIKLARYDASVAAFFLTRVTIHQGDTVKFIALGFHTFDFPGKSTSDLPLFVPGPTVSGDQDAAGNLFWFNGKVPSLRINPALFSPSGPSSYDGSTRSDSGLPAGKPKPFKLKFTKPGTYRYFCDVHPGMDGYVVVKAKGKGIPSSRQDAAALAKQIRAAVKTAKRVFKTRSPKGEVSLGAAGRDGVEDYAMFPSKLTVKRGAVVTFFMSKATRAVHTATFGRSAYLSAIAKSVTSPSPAQHAWYPSDNPALGPPLVSPTHHGNGFANTGVLDRDPGTKQIGPSGKLKFTTRGRYHYICLIHPFMRGTIVVK